MARSCKAARIRARPQRCIGRSFANIGEEVFGEVAKKSDLVTMRCDGERESVAFGDEGIELLRTFELMKRSFASGAFPRENEGVEVRARPVLGLNSQTKETGGSSPIRPESSTPFTSVLILLAICTHEDAGGMRPARHKMSLEGRAQCKQRPGIECQRSWHCARRLSYPSSGEGVMLLCEFSCELVERHSWK